MSERAANVSLAGWSYRQPTPPYPVLTNDELIARLVRDIEDAGEREDGRRVLGACLAAIHGDGPPGRVLDALTGLQSGPGPWLDQLLGAIFDEPELHEVQRAQLGGAVGMAMALVSDIRHRG